jgi:hypothetical protein
MTPEADRLARSLTTELENAYAILAGATGAERTDLARTASDLEARIAAIHRVEEAARAAARGAFAAEIEEAREYMPPGTAYAFDGTLGPWRDDAARWFVIGVELESSGIQLAGELLPIADAAFSAAYLDAGTRHARTHRTL